MSTRANTPALDLPDFSPQLDLLAPAPPSTWALPKLPRARRSNPTSSHEAADFVERTGLAQQQAARALSAVRAYPGRTSQELATLSQLDRYELARRLPELRVAGQVRNGVKRQCTVTGQQALEWWACVSNS